MTAPNTATVRLPPADPNIDLSIVIVTYRSHDDLQNCLRSIFEDGGADGLRTEVIVIDNASGDNDTTIEMCRREFPHVRTIANTQNYGFSYANNQGIEAATGRNILLLNPDTLVPQGALAKSMAWLDNQPATVGAMTCRVESTDGGLQYESARRLPTPWSECCRALLLDRIFARSDLFNRERIVGWDRCEARKVGAILGAFMLIKRSAMEKVGGLDTRFFLMYEDLDWCKRCADAGLEIWFVPIAHITHLGGSSWKQVPIMTYANSQLSAVLYMQKHHPRAASFVRTVSRIGMEIKILLLRLRALLKTGDTYTATHLPMAMAARQTLQSGEKVAPPTVHERSTAV